MCPQHAVILSPTFVPTASVLGIFVFNFLWFPTFFLNEDEILHEQANRESFCNANKMKEDSNVQAPNMSLEAYSRSVIHFTQQRTECSPTGSPNEGGRNQRAQQDFENLDDCETTTQETRQQVCALIQAALDLYDEMEEHLTEEVEADKKTVLHPARRHTQ